MYNQLQLRELFHLEFLRWFGRKVKATFYALKGGVNLRFFFNSYRYSEVMDIDVHGIEIGVLRDLVMGILKFPSFQNNLKPFSIEKIIPPNIVKAKQTETTQRFKIHLITSGGEDLFTKIEFSRRGLEENISVGPILDTIIRFYKLPPLLVPHYNVQSAVMQKICALSSRSIIQARDVFDLYILSTQWKDISRKEFKIKGKGKLVKAHESIFEVTFEQFRDTVLSYLAEEDMEMYKDADSWDEIRLRVGNFIDELREKYA